MASRCSRSAKERTGVRTLAQAVAFSVLAAGTTACGHSDAIDIFPHPTAVIASGPGDMPATPEAIASEAVQIPGPGTLSPDSLRSGKHAPTLIAAGPTLTRDVRHLAPHTVGETDAPYMLDAGDRIRVFVYGQPNLSRIYTIDGGGFISLPLIGAVKARAETTFDLERAITVQLAAKYIKDPKVSVEIATYRPFFILGEVRTAGQYPFVSGMTVQTAVAIAGGYSERANERHVIVTRRVNGVVEKLRVTPDMTVQPGDTINVRERFF